MLMIVNRAIVDYARKNQPDTSKTTLVDIEEFVTVPGYGVKCIVQGLSLLAGTRKWMKAVCLERSDVQALADQRWLLSLQNNASISEAAEKKIVSHELDGKTVVLIALRGSVVALIALRDSLKPGVC